MERFVLKRAFAVLTFDDDAHVPRFCSGTWTDGPKRKNSENRRICLLDSASLSESTRSVGSGFHSYHLRNIGD